MKRGFFLTGHGAPDFILTPFQNPKSSASWDISEKFSWVVGESLEAGELDVLEKEVFSQIDRGINRWIQDVKYFPRLFLSAATFLVVYFALSFAVRDPIPVFDELVAGIIAAAAVWVGMERKAIASDSSIRQRLELKQRVSDAEILIDQSVFDIESWLSDVSSLPVLELADCIVRCRNHDLPPLSGLPGDDFLPCLHEYISSGFPRLFALVPEIRLARKDVDCNMKLNSRLVRAGQSGVFGLALTALYVKACESF